MVDRGKNGVASTTEALGAPCYYVEKKDMISQRHHDNWLKRQADEFTEMVERWKEEREKRLHRRIDRQKACHRAR
jgi:hypothetical protein